MKKALPFHSSRRVVHQLESKSHKRLHGAGVFYIDRTVCTVTMHSVVRSPPNENTPIVDQSLRIAVPGASNQSKTNIQSGSRKTVPNTRLCQALSREQTENVCKSGGASPLQVRSTRRLFFEHLNHELFLNLIQFLQCRLQDKLIFDGAFSENASKLKGAPLYK